MFGKYEQVREKIVNNENEIPSGGHPGFFKAKRMRAKFLYQSWLIKQRNVHVWSL